MTTELVESALAARGRRLVVLDDGGVDDDLVRDMVEVLTWFCARLYGRRSARNRALKAGSAVRRKRLAWYPAHAAVFAPGEELVEVMKLVANSEIDLDLLMSVSTLSECACHGR